MQFLYIYIFIFVPTIVFFAILPSVKIGTRKFPNTITGLIVFSFISIILIARDIKAPADMVNYAWMYKNAFNFEYVFNAYHGNVFFSFLMYLGNFFNMSQELFFTLLSILYLYIFYLGLKLIFNQPKCYISAIVLFSLTSTFLLLFTNVIRQGLALSLLILAIGLILKRKKILAYFVMILAIFSHFSILPIILFLFLAKYISTKQTKFIYILLVPLLAILGMLLLSSFAQLSGLFQKIQSFSEKDYNNTIVYIKVIILYGLLCLFYIYGKRFDVFKIYSYKYIFNVYLLVLSLVIFTLPVLLLSSRFLYFASGLVPILLVFIFYSKRNFFNIKIRYLFFITGSIIYGLFVYNYPSVSNQLGV